MRMRNSNRTRHKSVAGCNSVAPSKQNGRESPGRFVLSETRTNQVPVVNEKDRVKGDPLTVPLTTTL